MINETIANNIKRVLSEKGIDYSELAKSMKYSRNDVKGMLSGKRTISNKELNKISKCCKVPVNEFTNLHGLPVNPITFLKP